MGRSCAATTRELLPYDLEGTRAPRAAAARGRAPDRRRAAEVKRAARRDHGRRPRGVDEDVHSAIERLLGEVGRKIHAGRSRNDQVAAAFRLVRRRRLRRGGRRCCARSPGAILDRAADEAETPMPGYTHLQRAIPVTRRPPPARLGRDAGARPRPLRASPPRRRAPSPLGAGALAGLDAAAAAAARPDAQLDRRGGRPRLRAGLPLRVRRPLHATSRASARSSCSGRPRSSASRACPRTAATGLVDDAAEAQPRRRRARARQGGHRDRAPDRPARDAEGRSRSPTTATCRRTSRQVFAARARRARRARGARRARPRARASTATASPPRAPTRSCARPTRPRRSSARVSRSATRTSRSPPRCAPARSSRPLRRRGSATWPPPSRRRKSDGREAARGLARRPRPAADRRPRARRGRGDPRPRRRR